MYGKRERERKRRKRKSPFPWTRPTFNSGVTTSHSKPVPERTSCVHALLLGVFMRHLARLVSETTKYKLRQITVLKWLSGWVHYPLIPLAKRSAKTQAKIDMSQKMQKNEWLCCSRLSWNRNCDQIKSMRARRRVAHDRCMCFVVEWILVLLRVARIRVESCCFLFCFLFCFLSSFCMFLHVFARLLIFPVELCNKTTHRSVGGPRRAQNGTWLNVKYSKHSKTVCQLLQLQHYVWFVYFERDNFENVSICFNLLQSASILSVEMGCIFFISILQHCNRMKQSPELRLLEPPTGRRNCMKAWKQKH